MIHEPPLDGRPRDIAFHFRAIDKIGPDKDKNFLPALADELAALCRQRGWTVCCIGHPQYAYCPPGVEDIRSVDLRRTVAGICSATLVVGEDSGPMHLAK